MKIITCPRCRRERKVRDDSMVARYGSVFRLYCGTCRLLRSIERHDEAIANLRRQVGERRSRGL